MSVSTVAALIAALGAGGDIVLAPGVWRNVDISGVHTHARILGPGAVIHDLNVTDSSGITFSGLEFSTAGDAIEKPQPKTVYPFLVVRSANIAFTGVRVHGDPRGDLSTLVSGMQIKESKFVTVSGSDFSFLHNGISQLHNEHLTLAGNHFHNIRDDGIRGGGSNFVSVIGNQCYDNHPDGKADNDHPDCIQFWTLTMTEVQHDIDIENNSYKRGNGHATQFIFMRGDWSDKPGKVFSSYANITIKGNNDLGSINNAIMVSNAKNVTIVGNTLTGLCAPEYGRQQTPWIRLLKVDGATVTGNSAMKIKIGGELGNANVKASQNTLTNCR